MTYEFEGFFYVNGGERFCNLSFVSFLVNLGVKFRNVRFVDKV